MNSAEIIEYLRGQGSEKNVLGMARFGISSKNTFGAPMPIIRELGKRIKKNHSLALELWDTEIHEARILASLIADSDELEPQTMDDWTNDFDSWDVCDQTCGNLYCYSKYADSKIFQWAESDKEFVRRTAFALIAYLAVRRKKVSDEEFYKFFDIIIEHSIDERNFVRKAVNWAIRQMGKRSMNMREEILKLCEQIVSANPNSKSAKWIVQDAVRELNDEKIINRILTKKS
jgi:3-methyladenine DNA glycosylase AlkD